MSKVASPPADFTVGCVHALLSTNAAPNTLVVDTGATAHGLSDPVCLVHPSAHRSISIAIRTGNSTSYSKSIGPRECHTALTTCVALTVCGCSTHCSPHVSVRASASATGAFESSPAEVAHSPARLMMVTSESPFSPRPLHTHPACATACAAIGTLADVRDRWDWRPEGTNKRLRADVHQRSENALHAR